MEKTWLDAIVRVLSESETALHYAEISDLILSQGYYSTDGATPAATVNAQIAVSIKRKADHSPFIRVGKGIFALKNQNIPATTAKQKPADTEPDDANTSIIHAFGMYWQRDLIDWKSEPRIFGKQQALATPVDFSKQKGIYILYDHHTVVYVGRSIDRPLGKRLYEHTLDRLNSRWNRFSWFGLLDVSENGDLRESKLNTSMAALVATLEALLIEALEPPQNRKRGDDLSGVEYLQGTDPAMKEKELQNTLRAIEQQMRGQR